MLQRWLVLLRSRPSIRIRRRAQLGAERTDADDRTGGSAQYAGGYSVELRELSRWRRWRRLYLRNAVRSDNADRRDGPCECHCRRPEYREQSDDECFDHLLVDTTDASFPTDAPKRSG